MLVLHMQLEAVDASEAWQHVLRVHLNLGVGDVGCAAVDLVNNALNIVALALAFVPFLQLQREVAVRRRLLEVVAGTGDKRVDAQLGQVFDTLLHLF